MHLTDYPTLDQTGINIDSVRREDEVLMARFGSAFRDSVRVGEGRHVFTMSAGVWPDSASIAAIGVDSWFEYYWSFYLARMAAGNQPFLITWRDRYYMVAFADPSMELEVFTSDLFAPRGIVLEQVRVRGMYHLSDGSLFHPISISGLERWYAADDDQSASQSAEDLSGNGIPLATATPPNGPTLTANGDHAVWRWDGTQPMLTDGGVPFTVTHGFLVACFTDAAFNSLNEGLISAVTIDGILVGDGATTKFFDLGYGVQFTYRKNGTSFANNNLQAPMGGVLGVLEFTFPSGNALDGLQLGEDRGFGTRLWKGDIAEVLLVNDTALSSANVTNFRRYLGKKYRITLA